MNSRPLRFGMTFLRQDNWDRVVEQVERYEAMGLDSAWVADHFVFPWDATGPWLEAWSLLGGLAARTRRIQLGTMVSHVIYRNPAILARTAMTVDRMSNGRLQLGLGTGASDYDWRRCEAQLNGLPNFVTEIDGLDIHFIHVRSPHEGALPLVVTHGWPGSVVEQLKIKLLPKEKKAIASPFMNSMPSLR